MGSKTTGAQQVLFSFFFFFKYFLLGLDNGYVGQAWTRTLATLCCMLFDLISSLEILVFLGWPSTAGTPKCGHGNPYDCQVEAFTPQTIPQSWPPDSLDYRRELILPANSLIIFFTALGCLNLKKIFLRWDNFSS